MLISCHFLWSSQYTIDQHTLLDLILFFLCIFSCLFWFVSTNASDCLERLVSKMTYYVSSGMEVKLYSLTQSLIQPISKWMFWAIVWHHSCLTRAVVSVFSLPDESSFCKSLLIVLLQFVGWPDHLISSVLAVICTGNPFIACVQASDVFFSEYVVLPLLYSFKYSICYSCLFKNA